MMIIIWLIIAFCVGFLLALILARSNVNAAHRMYKDSEEDYKHAKQCYTDAMKYRDEANEYYNQSIEINKNTREQITRIQEEQLMRMGAMRRAATSKMN